ncbi:MAG: hypothetical protein NVSMB32_14430 [Actinomycetota bacterium]
MSSFGGTSGPPEAPGEAGSPPSRPAPLARRGPEPEPDIEAEDLFAPEPHPAPALAAEPQAVPEPGNDGQSPFLEALATLMESRGLPLPEGLLEAPAQAYAGQGEGTVAMRSRLQDADRRERAGKVAGWQQRQVDRAEQAWESSPLIAEVRRRGLAEPPRPTRAVGAAFSLKKPLAKWSDAELASALAQWVELAGGSSRD